MAADRYEVRQGNWADQWVIWDTEQDVNAGIDVPDVAVSYSRPGTAQIVADRLNHPGETWTPVGGRWRGHVHPPRY